MSGEFDGVMRELWAFLARLVVLTLLTLTVLVSCVMWLAPAKAQGYELPPCAANLPQPPFVFVLPDGSEVAVTRWEYQLDSRRVVLVGNERLFCDGFE